MPDQTTTVSGDWTPVTSTSPSVFVLQSCLPAPTRIAGGWFDGSTGGHWSQDPENAATITHTAAGLELTPASTAFSDRAQVFQSFVTQEGASYRVSAEADQIAGNVQILVFDLMNTLTLLESESFASPGTLEFEFEAAGPVSRIYARVDGTTGTARVMRAMVDVSEGDQGLHRQSYPAPAGRLTIGRGSATVPPAAGAGVIVDAHAVTPVAMTLADIGPGTDGDYLWCLWDGPTGAEVWCSWRE